MIKKTFMLAVAALSLVDLLPHHKPQLLAPLQNQWLVK